MDMLGLVVEKLLIYKKIFLDKNVMYSARTVNLIDESLCVES